MIGACAAPQEQSSARRTVIVNAQVADGTGAALRTANVRIVGDRIERIGAFEPQSNDTVIDARGLVLAPGFIDMHNHSDDALERQPLAQFRSPGITESGSDSTATPLTRSAVRETRRRDTAALNLTAASGMPASANTDAEDFRGLQPPRKSSAWCSSSMKRCARAR